MGYCLNQSLMHQPQQRDAFNNNILLNRNTTQNCSVMKY